MADARIAYIQERLELGLDGWDPSPSVASFLENAKNKQVWPRPPAGGMLRREAVYQETAAAAGGKSKPPSCTIGRRPAPVPQ
jgi:hypothetical protein